LRDGPFVANLRTKIREFLDFGKDFLPDFNDTREVEFAV